MLGEVYPTARSRKARDASRGGVSSGPFLPSTAPSTASPGVRRCGGPPGTVGSMTAALSPVLRSLVALACLVTVLAMPDVARGEGSRWLWPLPAPHQVVHPFDPPEHQYGAGHRGIDIAIAAPGAHVTAVEAGTVRFAGSVAGRGVVSVVHADGLISTYEPVTGSVRAGQVVAAGDVLGTLEDPGGASHCAPALCLHLGAKQGEGYLDPLPLLGVRGPSVLLPVTGDEDAGASRAAGDGGAGPPSGSVGGASSDAAPGARTGSAAGPGTHSAGAPLSGTSAAAAGADRWPRPSSD